MCASRDAFLGYAETTERGSLARKVAFPQNPRSFPNSDPRPICRDKLALKTSRRYRHRRIFGYAQVKWYREGAKRELVRSMLAKSMLSRLDLYPRFGQTLWSHTLRRPTKLSLLSFVSNSFVSGALPDVCEMWSTIFACF